MESLYFIIQEELTKGLRRDSRLRINVTECEYLSGLKATEYGLVENKTPTLPVTGATFIGDWPFPQIFSGEEYRVVCTRNGVFEVDKEWVASKKNLYYCTTPSNKGSIVGGGPWQFCDFPNHYFLSNGVEFLYRSNLFGGNVVIGTPDLHISAITRFGNSLVLGGFYGDDGVPVTFSRSLWQEAWNLWTHYVGDYFKEDDVLDNWILIGPPLGGDIEVPFVTELALLGQVPFEIEQKMREIVLSSIETGRLKLIPVPNVGRIQHLIPIGDRIIVLGDKQVGEVVGQEQLVGRSYGFPGVMTRGAAATDGSSVVYIDRDTTLRRIGDGFSREGYREYFSRWWGTPVVMTYDSTEMEFYLCNGEDGYVLSRTGLGATDIHISSIIAEGEEFIGTHITVGDGQFELGLNPFDLGIPGLKYIDTLSLSYRNLRNIMVQFYFMSDKGGDWKIAPVQRMSPLGTVTPGVSGHAFIIWIRGDILEGAQIDSIKVHYKVWDKREIRGAYGIARQG